MKKSVRIGARGSRLAQIQAKSVLDRLVSLYPEIEFDLIKITTEGDRHRTVPVHRLSGYGVFVKELQLALFDGKIDLAVHSIKDLPVETPEGLSLAAVTERLDPRDVLVCRGKRLDELDPGSVIGTGSLRRKAQLLACRPDLRVQGIRGNIDTRLRRVSGGAIDAIIVAAASMIRLSSTDMISEYLPVERFLPSAGQGTLGIEIRSRDKELAELIQPLHDEVTLQSVAAERAFVKALGGGCSAAVASLGTVTGDTLRLRGMAAGDNGLLYDSEEGSAAAPEQVAGKLAQKLLARGALCATAQVKEP